MHDIFADISQNFFAYSLYKHNLKSFNYEKIFIHVQAKSLSHSHYLNQFKTFLFVILFLYKLSIYLLRVCILDLFINSEGIEFDYKKLCLFNIFRHHGKNYRLTFSSFMLAIYTSTCKKYRRQK